jgi:hypothetical protein
MKNHAAIKQVLPVRLSSAKAESFLKSILTGLACFILLGIFNCASQRPVGPAGPDGKQLTWGQMDFEQRKAHMKTAVLPPAAAIFKEWRPDKYAKTGCSLCHGDAETTGNFHMPTDHLPRLSGQVLLGNERELFPEATRIKLGKLVPAMADALGMSQFNIVTRKGFGCYSCHLGPTGPMFGH